MQELWYGDRRDRVKWGAIVYLANRYGIRDVLQVAYYRERPVRKLQVDDEVVDLPQAVWGHFSNLKNIENLGEQVRIKVDVIDEKFDHSARSEYIENVIKKIQQYGEKPLLVFLDPDTGIALKNAGPQHATIADIAEFWKALKPENWLIMYQHASRRKGWLKEKQKTFEQACDRTKAITIQGPDITKDVAFLAATKLRN
ncbi:MAG: ferrochelatase [Nitrospirae bacterium]|nr:MAG: ferrochelatase [Nitrospirota bacterium]